VPAESARLFRRVRRRDRWFVALAAGGVLVATPPAVLLSGRSGSDPGVGCVTTIVPGFMGGYTHTICGTAAVRFCHSHAARSGDVAAACRERVLAADATQP